MSPRQGPTGAEPGGAQGRTHALDQARPGDQIEVDGVGGGPPRRGNIVAVLGSGERIRLRVRWDERHESLFYPADRGYAIRVARRRRPPDASSRGRRRAG